MPERCGEFAQVSSLSLTDFITSLLSNFMCAIHSGFIIVSYNLVLFSLLSECVILDRLNSFKVVISSNLDCLH